MDNTSGTVPGQLMIRISESLAGPEVPDIDLSALGKYSITRTFPEAGRFEARHRAEGLHCWYTVTFDESEPLTKATVDISSVPGIELIEPVPVIKSTDLPFNDPKLSQLWGLNNTGEKEQWNEGCDVNAFKAWTVETGKPEVIVAVNDMGVDYSHEDLAANMWVNTAELNGIQGEDDDNNGYVDDIYGYSFMSYDGTSTIGKIEPGDHGTHVAGTIGGVSNNGIGIAGVAGGNGTPGTGIRIMCTQTLDGKHGAMTPASIVYAADNGAVLINCSWGYTNPETPTSSALTAAFKYFNNNAGMDPVTGKQSGPMAGGLVIFAAGNEGLEVSHPAMDEEVFAVAALSANYVRSYFTSFGEWVDICAPGGDANRGTYILSTVPDNKYANMQGSSMAAPHVTGVAALVVSYFGVGKPGFTRDKLIYTLQSTANKRALDENGSYATKLGSGLVDAYAALISGEDTAPLPVTEASATAKSNTITFKWTVPGSEEIKHPYSYNLYYGKNSLAGLDPDNLPEGVTKVNIPSYGTPYGMKMSYDITGLEFNTNYHLRIGSESLTGLCSDLSSEITVQTGSNTKPVITALDGTSMTLSAHETKTLRFKISDADGHSLTYSLDKEPKYISSWLDFDIVNITVEAQKADPGTYSGVLSVSDSFETVEQEFTYTVKANATPRATGTIEDQLFTAVPETRTFNLAELFTDDDNEPLTYSISASGPSIIAKTEISAAGILTLTSHSYGSQIFNIKATDAMGATAGIDLRVLVKDGSTPLEAYPNPVKDYLNVRPEAEGTVSLKIVSSLGATVYDQSSPASPFTPAVFDLKSLPSGIYKAYLAMDSITRDFNLVKL